MLIKLYLLILAIYVLTLALRLCKKTIRKLNSDEYYNAKGIVTDIYIIPKQIVEFNGKESVVKEISRWYRVCYQYTLYGKTFDNDEILKYNIYKVGDKITVKVKTSALFIPSKTRVSFWLEYLSSIKGQLIALYYFSIQLLILGLYVI